ncbi:MAG: hypothetical protein PHX44_07085 [Sulfurimonas sp.]|uniref:hypothetical protein n=1 Tax=Sulfurimonas sp. TaxID=2022749 RepID=UPI0026175175|nr:hypothetical protein [Sulfurimonas sp.]MDD2652796.1 hypothetical protein [Sulfurimonas sp.]MDD3452107.1 hypothetical protein [Sulfurimonas sp.]
MKLSVDEYCKRFKMSKEMVYAKIRAKKLDYVVEESQTFIIVPAALKEGKKTDLSEKTQLQNIPSAKPKTTVATVLALFQKENNYLKNRIVQLESKIDKLIDDKEQMLRSERDKIEQIYSSKDEQLKNILTLVNKKMRFEQEKDLLHEAHKIENYEHQGEAEVVRDTNSNAGFVELKEYLRTLPIRSSQRKAIKKRFLAAYDNDTRVIHKNGQLYLDFSKYDYSDLLAY